MKSKFIDLDGSKFAVQHTFDMTPNIESAQQLRSNEIMGDSERRLVGRIDARLVHKLISEAGIRWDDKPAVAEHIDKLMNDGTLSKLRVWEGQY